MTSGLPARRAAVTALTFVLTSRTALDTALIQAPDFAGLDPRDRAFARLVSATTLRRRGQIGAVMNKLMQRPLPDAALPARLILETAVAQLVFLGTKPHAAVSGAVDLAKSRRDTDRFSGLINAVLRKVVTQGKAVADATPLAANLPAWLRESWLRAYGAETLEGIAAAAVNPPPLDLTLRDPDTAGDWAEKLGMEILPTGTLRKREIGDITALTGFEEGHWWAQDAGAAIPARLLGARKGETVLDLCAAPGGKTMQLASTGADVTALDASPKRMKKVEENLERTGLKASCVTDDGQVWGEDGSFDAILLDAPCSATGTLRRRPDAAWIKNAEDVQSLQPIQNALFRNATRLLKPGGRLVICTCSLQPEEGERWLESGLRRQESLVVDPIRPEEMPGLEAAILENGSVRLTPALWPERGGIDGFFIARLKKSGGS
ncbi:RsmB/NOP family class I SAM-dependent RNA methyltransferase [Hyphobacterium sp. HN65]|uniref:RsmB/NOP family class I SAM-dependent RNA methyltransferase n=1 Tax=Hyphobacterium lacteum TaxID=3116575 RepID=A0ABU7LRL8_9PROT|nr:RsmB/NOP family class I SAM-dependent RNA methyltransferase [Hyphobacterium sp. HN65]MEE2526551.1 RsmB/NOP family class I SAM-dependent RNA methyltransferase [Hyphobacterium sp. HN65]